LRRKRTSVQTRDRGVLPSSRLIDWVNRGIAMRDVAFARQLDFLVDQVGEKESSILSRALQAGIGVLYQEALIEAYLLGKIDREKILSELGPDKLEDVDYERDAVTRDVAWGLERG